MTYESAAILVHRAHQFFELDIRQILIEIIEEHAQLCGINHT